MADSPPDWIPDTPFDRPPVPAAVLIALVERDAQFSVLYTLRAASLRSHSGQIAFPGGKIDPDDAGPAAAALREAAEEVGLEPDTARVIGYMPDYYSGTNYMITPVVAHVRPTTPFTANPSEVDGFFEVPLDFLAQAGNYTTHKISRRGREHETWRLMHAEHMIWGITANLTRSFRDLALQDYLP